MNKIAMIYARGENKHLQVAKCEEYAEKKGYQVVAEVFDDTEEIYKELGDIEVLLVSDMSRLTRSKTELEQIRRSLEADGIEIKIAE